MENKLLNLTEACTYCGISDETMRKAIKKKEIPCRFFRSKYLFSKLVLDLWASGLNFEDIQKQIEKSITSELVNQIVKEKISI